MCIITSYTVYICEQKLYYNEANKKPKCSLVKVQFITNNDTYCSDLKYLGLINMTVN